MRHLFSMLLVASMVLVAAAAHARADEPPAWDATFTTTTIDAHLPKGRLEILVLPVGGADPALRAPADALAAALRGSSRVATVVDDASLGPVGAVDDATALARSRALPVTVVAIVRLLAGDPPKALVSFYAQGHSEPIASFIATAGVALAPPPPSASEPSATSGVSRTAIDQVDTLNQSSADDVAAAKARYQREYVGYDGIEVTVTGGNGPWVSARVRTQFYQGDVHQPIDGAAFYKAVGRDDLAASYESRDNTRTAFMVGGLVVGLASIIPMAQYEDCDIGAPSFDSCMDRDTDRIIWATVLMGAGLGTFLVARMVDPDPVSDAERRGLAQSHNVELKSGLHLDASRAVAPRRRSWALAPAVTPGYQGVSLALAF